MPGMPRALVVKVTCGADDPERANQALTVAAAGVTLGAPVTLWLTGEGAWFGVADRTPDLGLGHATSASDLLATVLDGGEVVVCTQCAVRRGIEPEQLRDGVTIRGAVAFAAQVLEPDVQALVY